MSIYRPPVWLRNAHVQTLWPPLGRRHPRLATRRERIRLPDLDFLDLDWYLEKTDPTLPLVVLFHGLTGSSTSQYIVGMQSALANRRWQSVAVNFRGCSGVPNRLPRAYHSGETGDIDFVLTRIRKQFPQRVIMAIGYSLGGNALCKWLGEKGDESGIDAAVIVSAPYELARCATRLDQGFSRVYRQHLIQQLVNYIQQKKQLFRRLNLTQDLLALERLGNLERIRSFWEYDEAVVAPLHGFASALDYYQQSSARQFVPKIRTPTLLVHAKDDPFMPDDVAPTKEECPESVELIVTQHGGHVGFVLPGNKPWQLDYWLEHKIPEWFEAIVGKLSGRQKPSQVGTRCGL